MDKLTPEQRHKNMAAIHSKNTKPELIVRRFLFAHGFRFRLNHPRLPGHPDIVLRKYATCVFVNGCFWHGHDGCSAYRIPKTNTDFWTRKINRNKNRDAKTLQQLNALGWNCITIWECQLKPAVQQQTLNSLQQTLLQIYLHKTQPETSKIPTTVPTVTPTITPINKPSPDYNFDDDQSLHIAAEE